MTDESSTFTGEFLVPGADERIEADHRARYEWAGAWVQGVHVLDIACGAGYGSKMLAEAGAQSVVGVDVSDAALDHARRHYGDGDVISFEYGDIATFAGRDGGYDLVTCFETIEHVPDYDAALKNLVRLVAPGGTMLISSPYRPLTTPGARSVNAPPRNVFHVREFLPGELANAMRAVGFDVEPFVYGQRLQPISLPKVLQLLYNRVIMPKTSSRVRSVESAHPRYFCLCASRPEQAE